MSADLDREDCPACDQFRDLAPLLHNDANWRRLHHAMEDSMRARIGENRRDVDLARKVLWAWTYSQSGGKGSKNPIIRARKLYRMVRESIEAHAREGVP